MGDGPVQAPPGGSQKLTETWCQTASSATPSSSGEPDSSARLDFDPRAYAALMQGWKHSWAGSSSHYAFQIFADPSPQFPNNQAARFEVRAGDYASDADTVPNEDGIVTERSELKERFQAAIGQVYWYRLRTFIPQDFPIEENRLVILQWHASDTGKEATSPPLAFYYRGGKLIIKLRHSDRPQQLKEEDIRRVELYRQENFARGVWHDFVIQVKWSYRDDGFVNIWIDGKEAAHYKGPSAYNDAEGPYVKFGLYRDAEYIVGEGKAKRKLKASDPYIIFHDDYRRGPTCQSVMED